MVQLKTPATNIGLAIVGQTVVYSTLVILFGFYAKIWLTFSKCPTIANSSDVVGNLFDHPNMAKPSTKVLLKEILSDDIEWVYVHISNKAVEWAIAGFIDEANKLLEKLWAFDIPHQEICGCLTKASKFCGHFLISNL